jgi:hypothetical protein
MRFRCASRGKYRRLRLVIEATSRTRLDAASIPLFFEDFGVAMIDEAQAPQKAKWELSGSSIGPHVRTSSRSNGASEWPV